jgi:hypothetical protein
VASSSTAAASAASRSGRLLECVFEFMAGTYQAPTRTQAPNPNLGTTCQQRLLLADEH